MRLCFFQFPLKVAATLKQFQLCGEICLRSRFLPLPHDVQINDSLKCNKCNSQLQQIQLSIATNATLKCNKYNSQMRQIQLSSNFNYLVKYASAPLPLPHVYSKHFFPSSIFQTNSMTQLSKARKIIGSHLFKPLHLQNVKA